MGHLENEQKYRDYSGRCNNYLSTLSITQEKYANLQNILIKYFNLILAASFETIEIKQLFNDGAYDDGRQIGFSERFNKLDKEIDNVLSEIKIVNGNLDNFINEIPKRIDFLKYKETYWLNKANRELNEYNKEEMERRKLESGLY